jgi:hypothetical protein
MSDDDGLILKHRDKLRQIIDAWQFCGCGSDEGKWGIVLWVLEHAHFDKDRENIYGFVAANPALDTWVEFAVQIVDKMGLLEHGGSYMGSWLDGHEDGIGAAMLAFLRTYGIDQDNWPGWSLDEMYWSVDRRIEET